jgi:two-component system CheB/CheR fusion protein
LAQRPPFPRIDLVLCRNVLIYFTKELQSRTLGLFAFSLREGGYLVLGKGETTSSAPESYHLVHPQNTAYRRFGARVFLPSRRTPREPHASARDRLEPLRPSDRFGPARSGNRARAEGPSLQERVGNTLYAAPIGFVVVDRRYAILAINAEAQRLLNLFGAGTGEDIVHLVRENGVALRDTLDAALRGQESAHCRFAIPDPACSAARTIEVVAYPERSPAGALVEGTLVVHITDATVNFDDAREAADLRTRNAQLVESQRALTGANQALTDVNVNLVINNENLLIAGEESESSNEEIETLNEELQATNEELETLNEELQATVEDVKATNEELHAREERYDGDAR